MGQCNCTCCSSIYFQHFLLVRILFYSSSKRFLCKQATSNATNIPNSLFITGVCVCEPFSFHTWPSPSGLSLSIHSSFVCGLTAYMGRSHLVLALCLLLLAPFVCTTYGSRQTKIFKMIEPNSQNSSPGTFSGFFPKGMPIPPSGPSKKHYDIGLQSSEPLP